MGGLLVAFLILVILILAVVVSCIKIVPQAHAYIVERLGGYLATWPWIEIMGFQFYHDKTILSLPVRGAWIEIFACR